MPVRDPLPRIPWWGLVSAVVAPVAYIGGWWWAGSLVTGYDPISSTVSDLAALGAPNRWLMTTALFVTGIAHIVTAVGMRPADPAGRSLLAVGGFGVLLVAWLPNSAVGHNVVSHMLATYLAIAALTLWPAVIARNQPGMPLVLRPRFGQVLTIAIAVLAVVTLADIVTGGATLGLRERTLTSVQALAPLAVVIGIRYAPAHHRPLTGPGARL